MTGVAPHGKFLHPRLLYTAFKYTVYLLLAVDTVLFFQEDLAASAAIFGGSVSWHNVVEAFTAAIDTAAWLVLLLLFELETVELVDRPRIELKDGDAYKESGSLSTGQKCTSILPILLLDSENPLLVDQPEFGLSDKPEIHEQFLTYSARAVRNLLDELGIEPLFDTVDAVHADSGADQPVILLSPQGRPFTQAVVAGAGGFFFGPAEGTHHGCPVRYKCLRFICNAINRCRKGNDK